MAFKAGDRIVVITPGTHQHRHGRVSSTEVFENTPLVDVVIDGDSKVPYTFGPHDLVIEAVVVSQGCRCDGGLTGTHGA